MKITPEELIEYTVLEKVRDRNPNLLEYDILEAETEITNIPGITIPEGSQKAKLALLKLAQFYALANQDESFDNNITSETIGDYSYTLADGTTFERPDIYHLLREYIPARAPFRMSSI